MSKAKKRRCQICHKWFLPDPRTAYKQTCCSAPNCQKQRKARTDINWRQKNPDYDKSRKAKIRQWAAGPPGYWQSYRRSHPQYVLRDNLRRKIARQKVSRAAKQDLMAKISVEKIESTAGREAPGAAKQDLIASISVEKIESIRALPVSAAAKYTQVYRRINGILDYLIWKETAAKQDQMALSRPVGP